MEEGIGDFSVLAYLPHESDPLLIEREGLDRLAHCPGDSSEQEEAAGNAACIIQFSRESQALLSQYLCPIMVALQNRSICGRLHDLGAQGSALPLASGEGPLQKRASLTIVPMHYPECLQ